MRMLFIFMLVFVPVSFKAQIFDPYAASSALQAQRDYVNAYGQMAQRARQIMYSVQPLRQSMYEKYQDKQYREAINICYNTYKQYVYYKFDNKAISDMELLAGNCAVELQDYETAIQWYSIAQEAGEREASSKLSGIFYKKMRDARRSYDDSNYYQLSKDVSLALKTGWESGECYFYKGKCFEVVGNFKEAKKMYKLAKKKGYSYATTALKELKKKK